VTSLAAQPQRAVPGGDTAPTSRPGPAIRWRALPVLMAGTFILVLDFFIVNVAIPSVQRDLRASPSEVEWVVAGYGLAFAVLIITGGRIGDLIGRRRAFSIGVALFGLASAACGLAPDPGVLIAARVAQGIGAAMISPNVLSLIGVLYTGRARVRAITIYGMVMGVAAACGQIIGGLVIQADVAGSAWRAIFLINVPIGAVALALVGRLVPESRAEGTSHLDLGGVSLATLALVALAFPLVQGRQFGWPVWMGAG
jgi:MFS family permease